jgi:hypothetical protein
VTYAAASIGINGKLPPITFGDGTLTEDSTYYYITFTGSGNFTVNRESLLCNYLVVGGGGGGGGGTSSRAGGGGGAGGLLMGSTTYSSGIYDAAAGSGGNGGSSAGENGQDSILVTSDDFIFAFGGGGGGAGGLTGEGLSGGSGGGGGVPTPVGFSTPGSGTSGQGNDGFRGWNTGMFGSYEPESGQGGGAGGPGISGSTQGNGLSNATLDAISLATSTGGFDPFTSSRKGYAGGGFASGVRDIGSNIKYGAGFSGTQSALAEDAVATSGSGGGGGGQASAYAFGGDGGSGVVIIYYLKSTT